MVDRSDGVRASGVLIAGWSVGGAGISNTKELYDNTGITNSHLQTARSHKLYFTHLMKILKHYSELYAPACIGTRTSRWHGMHSAASTSQHVSHTFRVGYALASCDIYNAWTCRRRRALIKVGQCPGSKRLVTTFCDRDAATRVYATVARILFPLDSI